MITITTNCNNYKYSLTLTDESETAAAAAAIADAVVVRGFFCDRLRASLVALLINFQLRLALSRAFFLISLVLRVTPKMSSCSLFSSFK